MKALLVAVLAGCTHVAVSAQPSTIIRHVAEFNDTGYAQVEVDEGGTIGVAADDTIVVTVPGHEHSHLWGLIKTGKPDEQKKMTVGNFVAGCNSDNTGTDCLGQYVRDPILVGSKRKLSPKYLAIGLFGAVATAVGFTCLVACSNRSGWAWVGTGLAVITLIVPLSTVY